jgi:hypothetical protein
MLLLLERMLSMTKLMPARFNNFKRNDNEIFRN